MSLTKTAVNKLLVAERKSMRQKQKQSAFMRKTLNIYNGMVKRAKELGRDCSVSIQFIRDEMAKTMAESCCVYCGDKLTLSRIAADHPMPVARGGEFSEGNLDFICKSCNWQKGIMHNGEFHLFLAQVRTFPETVQADIKRRLTIGGKWSFKS